jgi:hypothetical protein
MYEKTREALTLARIEAEAELDAMQSTRRSVLMSRSCRKGTRCSTRSV